jgi:hypothetical protein
MSSLSLMACDNDPIFGSRVQEPPDDKIGGDPADNDPTDDG